MRQTLIRSRATELKLRKLEQAFEQLIPLTTDLRRAAGGDGLADGVKAGESHQGFGHAADQRNRFGAGAQAMLLTTTALEW